MKTILLLLPWLAASWCDAAVSRYVIKAQVYVDGALVSSPQIITADGTAATISQHARGGSLELKVLAHGEPSDSIHMRFDINYKSASGEVGSHQDVDAIAGQAKNVVLDTTSTYPSANMELRVLATRE